MKRIVSVFCAMCLLIGCAMQAKAIMGTYDQSVEWARDKVGTSVDKDGKNGAQCEDLIYAYYEHLSESPMVNGQYGKASDYITNAIPSNWERISSDITLKPGDIAVYKTNFTAGGTQITGANGHIGVVTAVNSGTFSLVHQNYNGSGKCEETTGVPVSYLACVIRPSFSEIIIQPGIICFWNPYPEKHSVGTTNAVLAGLVETNADVQNITDSGIHLYNSDGALLKSKTEAPKAIGAYGCYLWFDVNQDLGYALTPGASYQYKLFLVVDGETHYSSMYSFTTLTHIHNYVNGYCNDCDGVSFPDVKLTAWYYNAVKFAAKKGYFSGRSNGTFGAGDNITRQDFVVVMSRIAGANLNKYSGKTNFADVPSNAYYAKAIHWATENGIISGYDATKFGVGDKLTREQLVTIMYRYAKKQGMDVTVTTGRDLMAAYPDATTPNPGLREMVAWALEKGIISGKQVNGKTCIAPRDSASRAETAQILLNINTKGIIPGI